jgi:predicted phage terminase large subunit-like protein
MFSSRYIYAAELMKRNRNTKRDDRKGEFLRLTTPFDSWIDQDGGRLNWHTRHHKYLYEMLETITNGTAKRLMIFMPPRHSKSETVTIRYVAWRLLSDPAMRVIIGCYNQKLANRFSKRIRRILEDNNALSETSRAADEWETVAGGGLKAVGAGAGITGFGADLVVIDDPVKNRAEAESTRRRDNAWDWYSDDIYTRLEPDAPVILIQTRWHEDDLAGRLIEQMTGGGEQWQIVKLPAFACVDDPLGRPIGEPLWPERFNAEHLERIKAQQGSYSFSALYQQEPMPADDGLFQRKWFAHVVDRAPAGLRWVRGYDLAISTKDTADRTASFRCAIDADGNLYIADGFAGRIDFPEQRRYVLDRLNREKETIHCVESALHGTALVQDIRSTAPRNAGRLTAVRPSKDKVTRALRWSPIAESGKVRLVKGAWVNAFIDEACTFPAGTHDDQIDAVSIAVDALMKKRGKLWKFE